MPNIFLTKLITRGFKILGLVNMAALAMTSLVQAEIAAQYTVLDNGLKVILYPNHRAPIVSCRIFYVTGSVHEAPGHTGIAHLLEHMLFKGTKKVGTVDSVADAVLESKIENVMMNLEAVTALLPLDSGKTLNLRHQYDSLLSEQRKLIHKYELWEAYEKNGGTGLNAFTSDLMTAYIVSLPKNKVDLFLWLESDRMQNAILREFYPERDVVQEERRMRVEDSPTGRYWESLMGVFYEAHPFRFPTIGYPSDIKALSQAAAAAHYKSFYKPNNCILVLAGDINAPEALEKIKQYFAPIKRGADFPPVLTQEPPQIGQKRMIVEKNAAEPRLDMLFHTPGFPDADLYTFDILEGVLSGKSGRLYKKLVKDLKIATSADGGNGVDKYTSNFSISAQLGPNPKADKVESAIWEVLNELAEKPISERELQRAKNQVLARSQRSLEDLDELATELAYWEMRGGWNNINTFPANVQKVTADDVQRIAKEYFLKKKSTVGILIPEIKPLSKEKTDKKNTLSQAKITEGEEGK